MVAFKDNNTDGKYNWQETLWVLAVGGRAGLLIAFPVLLGLGVGYLLDRSLGTLPFITLFFTLLGIVGGPILVYRWIKTTVQKKLDEQGNKKDV